MRKGPLREALPLHAKARNSDLEDAWELSADVSAEEIFEALLAEYDKACRAEAAINRQLLGGTDDDAGWTTREQAAWRKGFQQALWLTLLLFCKSYGDQVQDFSYDPPWR